MRRLAIERKLEICGSAAADARFALAVIRPRENEKQAGDEGQNQARVDVAFQSSIQETYNILLKRPERERFGGSTRIGFRHL